MAAPSAPVIVATKSAWLSKTNWVAGLTGLGAIVTQFTPLLPPEWQGKATAFVALLGAVGVWITRTFFTTSLTPSSTADLPSAANAIRASGASEAQVVDALNAAQITAK